MLKLSTNSPNFIARSFSLCLILFSEYLLIRYGMKDPGNNHTIGTIKAGYILYFLIALLAFALILIAFSFLGIIKVTVDKSSGTITLFSVIRKTTITTNDIDHYFITKNRTRFKVFEGLILKLKTENKIQLAGQNLLSISDFKDYLVDKKIPCKGERKMIFPFN